MTSDDRNQPAPHLDEAKFQRVYDQMPPAPTESRGRAPLPIPEDSFFASMGEQRARQYVDEYYAETGQTLDLTAYGS